MKVLLTNGSPHRNGCTYTALCEVAEALNKNGIDTDIFWIGNKPVSGCIACKTCVKNNKCVFNDTVNEFLDIAGDYDGFVFGTPVHWGGASGNMTSFMDRVFMWRWPTFPFKTCCYSHFSKTSRNNSNLGSGK